MKNTKRALLLSVVSMFLCVVMLASTTFAWFTDSVESTGNIIKTGTLKVDLLNDGVSLKTNTTHKIFDYSLWEPGYTQVEGIKLVNDGNLHFKYQLAIVPNGTVSALANVIDVYLLDSAADRNALTNKVGTLADVLNANGILISGDTAALTLADGAVVFDKVVAFKMQESAGNEYQNMSLVSGGFSVRLLATQLTKEEDSFDDQYDDDAEYDTGAITTAEDLKTALEQGGEFSIGEDIDFTIPGSVNAIDLPAGVDATLDLAGHALIASPDSQAIISKGNLTIKNGNIVLEAPTDSLSGSGAVSAQLGGVLTLENVKIEVTGGMTHAVTVSSGTLNLNEGTEIIIKGSGYQTGVICFGNGDVVNINGGKIIIDAPANSTTSVGIGSYNNCTVNANSGAITVNDGAQHYGVGEFIPGISLVLNLKSGFAINAEGSATAIDSSVTVVNN